MVVVIVLLAALLAILAVRLGGSSGPDVSTYAYYQSMMSRYGLSGGSMMGGNSHDWMMSAQGYDWIAGGVTSSPAWQRDQRLPGFMMGSETDPGRVMGRLFAGAPGPRVSSSVATMLGNQVPAGGRVDKSANGIVFTVPHVTLTIVASPAGGSDETFRAAGLVNPTIVVQRGASVTLHLVNADSDTAHGLVVTTNSGVAEAQMPMMVGSEAFRGAAVWFLGDRTSAGMHEGTMSFAADRRGVYRYVCPVPGHARQGMFGTFVVKS